MELIDNGVICLIDVDCYCYMVDLYGYISVICLESTCMILYGAIRLIIMELLTMELIRQWSYIYHLVYMILYGVD